MRIVKLLCGVAIGLPLLSLFGLSIWPPELLRVGSAYSAKIVCSNVFLAHRDPNQVLATDVQAPGNPLLRLARVSVDRTAGQVEASFLGFIAPRVAAYREGLGCAVLPDGKLAEGEMADRRPLSGSGSGATAAQAVKLGLWPDGEDVLLDPNVMQVLADERLAGPGMRAMIVVRDGRIVGERYGAGFDAATPLLGWSMTKTVTAALVGAVIQKGDVALDTQQLLPAWKNDARGTIRVADLLSMQSGLQFNEDYGAVSDVTRMLFLSADSAAFATSRPLAHPPGTGFHYSTGSAVLLAKVWMSRLSGQAEALAYPHEALFGPLGMKTAVLEADAAGTYVGGSYMYAAGRDWARFGLLLAQQGMWNGQRILPADFVGLMQRPNTQSNGRYSQAQTWLPRPRANAYIADTFNMQGHDGQTISIMPKAGLIVLRMGLTPSGLAYDPGLLVGAVAKATGVGP